MQVETPQTDSDFRHITAYLYLSAFISGVVTLGVEFGTSRLISNIFSNSNVVWAGVVGMTLLYLAIGYFLGGRWADRSASPSTFFKILAWTSLTVALMPVVALPLLRAAADSLQYLDLAIALVSASGIAVLFVIPMTLLGCLPPFLIRLSIRRISRSGQITGRIYALSTAGGLVGVFGTVFFLIPAVGSAGSFVVNAGLLMLVALIGVWLTDARQTLRFAWMPLALVIIAVVGLQRPLKAPPPGSTLLYEGESQYNYLQVVESQGTRYLLINETLAVHSVYNPDRLETSGTWDYFAAAPYFNDPVYQPERVQKVALLGLAAGTVARQFTAVYGPIQIDGVEIDPAIVKLGREYFGMTMPNLNVVTEDARFAATQLGDGYQVIGIDAYRPPYIPWQLTTQEFFQEIQRHLADTGVVVINVGRTETDRRLVEAMTATMLTVFPTVHTMDVPHSFNTILVATNQPTVDANLAQNYQRLGSSIHPFLAYSLEAAFQALRPTVASDLVFTDDLAPVEFIADSLVIQFALEGGAAAFPSEPQK